MFLLLRKDEAPVINLMHHVTGTKAQQENNYLMRYLITASTTKHEKHSTMMILLLFGIISSNTSLSKNCVPIQVENGIMVNFFCLLHVVIDGNVAEGDFPLSIKSLIHDG